MEGLFMTITNVNFDDKDVQDLINLVNEETENYLPENDGCGTCCGAGFQNVITRGDKLFRGDPDIVAMRTLLLLGLRGMAAYAHHAYVLGFQDKAVNEALFTGMRNVGTEHSMEAWLEILHQFGLDNFRCMELLDQANTGSYGHPRPTAVTMQIDPGPINVVT